MLTQRERTSIRPTPTLPPPRAEKHGGAGQAWEGARTAAAACPTLDSVCGPSPRGSWSRACLALLSFWLASEPQSPGDFPGRRRGAGSVTLSDKGPSVPIRAPFPQALGHEAPWHSAEEGPVSLWVLTARAWASVGACVTERPRQFLIPSFLAHYVVRRSWGFSNWN